MRAVLAGLVLLVPLLASSQPRIQKVEHSAVAVSVVTRESIERVGVLNAEVFLRGQSLGVTNATGELAIRGLSVTPRLEGPALANLVLRDQGPRESPIPLAATLRDYELFAAFAPSTETDGGAVILLDSADELAVTLGERPHAIVDVPVDWSCSGVAFTYDADENTLDAEPSGCSEPAILELSCPVSLQAGETGAFQALLSGSYDRSVEWSVRDANGADLDVEYVTDETEMDNVPQPSPIGQMTEIDRMAIRVFGDNFFDVESEAIVTASLGDERYESCPVGFENDPGGLAAYESILRGDWDGAPSARVTVGYNFEFGSISGKVGANAPIPVGVPLYGDLSVGYYSDGDVGYGLLQAEVQCRTELMPLMTLFWGGGLHLLRQSSNGNSNIEIGPGVSGRIHYDGGWPVEPIVELNASYYYDTVIPTLSLGAAYRFNR